MKNIIHFLVFLFFINTLTISQVPIPVKDQDHPILLKGATVHIGDGTVIEHASVGFDRGKITLVLDEKEMTLKDLSGYEIIDVPGQHIYPGFILPNTQLGLQEVTAVRAMTDQRERGNIHPEVRSLIAYNTDSEIIPTLRFNGILLAESTPTGGLVSGTSSVMELEGWNWEDAVHTKDIAIHMNWPQKLRREFDFSTFTVTDKPNKQYDQSVRTITTLFTDARVYGEMANPISNLKLQALQGLFDGTKTLMIHANGPKEIIQSIRFAQENGVQKITLLAGENALMVSDFLKTYHIPVILPPIHSLPSKRHYDVDLPYKLATLLSEEGIVVSLSHSGMLPRARNLSFYAGTCVAYGMEKEDAIKTVTLNTAIALGIDSRVGSITKGKDATLFVSKGDALDFRTNNLSYAFIRGKKITLPARQQALFNRYSEKYGHVK